MPLGVLVKKKENGKINKILELKRGLTIDKTNLKVNKKISWIYSNKFENLKQEKL